MKSESYTNVIAKKTILAKEICSFNESLKNKTVKSVGETKDLSATIYFTDGTSTRVNGLFAVELGKIKT